MIRVGDIVRLNSGGPPMTVTHRTVEGVCECKWRGVFGERTAPFPEGALTFVRRPDYRTN